MFIFEYIQIMWRYSARKTQLFFFLTILSSLTEGINLILLVPLLGVLQGPQHVEGDMIARALKIMGDVGIPLNLIGILSVFFAAMILRSIIQYLQTLHAEKFRLELLDDLRAKSFGAVLDACLLYTSPSPRDS